MKGKTALWIPILFTLLYFGFALYYPAFDDWLTWLFGLIPLALAGLASILLWAYFSTWVRGSQGLSRLLILAIVLPGVIFGVPVGMVYGRSHRLAVMNEKITKEGRLIDTADEELLTANGNPIGVRLRVHVRYPEGVGPLVEHIPPPDLSAAPVGYRGGFGTIGFKYEMLNATDYVFTNDVVPDFMPQAIRSGRGDSCFIWSGSRFSRTDMQHPAARTFTVYFQHPRYTAPTHSTYDPQRFYEGAVKEGAKECP